MARTKTLEIDPATGRPLPAGVSYRGEYQYRARALVDGKRVSATRESARAAAAWLEEIRVDRRRGQYVDRTVLDKTTLRQLVERFVTEVLVSRRGVDGDSGHIPAILTDQIASLSLSKINIASVRGFRERQKRAGYAPATIVKRLNLLASIFSHAESEWDFPFIQNPASGKKLKRPKGADQKRNRRLLWATAKQKEVAESKGRPEPTTEEDALLGAISESENPWDLWLTKWAIASAMRQSEAFALEWRDISLNEKKVVVAGKGRLGGKTASKREERSFEVRPLVPEAIKILEQLLQDVKPVGLVFPAGSQKAFAVRFGRMTRRAKLEDLTYHDLRHEATSRLAKLYPNPLDLMRATGHRLVKSLDRYYNPDPTDLAVQAMLATLERERAKQQVAA